MNLLKATQQGDGKAWVLAQSAWFAMHLIITMTPHCTLLLVYLFGSTRGSGMFEGKGCVWFIAGPSSWQDLLHGTEGSLVVSAGLPASEHCSSLIKAMGEVLCCVSSEKQAHLLLSSQAWHPPKIITVASQLLELRAYSTWLSVFPKRSTHCFETMVQGSQRANRS